MSMQQVDELRFVIDRIQLCQVTLEDCGDDYFLAIVELMVYLMPQVLSLKKVCKLAAFAGRQVSGIWELEGWLATQ